MPAVSSSAISWIDYDAEKKTLTVTFKSGNTYDYSGVSQDVATAFLEAPSKGKFFARRIKDAYPSSQA